MHEYRALGWLRVAPGRLGNRSWNGAGLLVIGEDLFVGGHFSNAGSVAVTNLAIWNGVEWNEAFGGVLNPSPSATETVLSLAVVKETIYVGGYFQFASGSPATNIARLVDDRWEPLISPNTNRGAMRVTALLADGDSLIVGQDSFRTYPTPPSFVNVLLRWDGTNWSKLGGDVTRGSGGAILAMAFHGSDLYITGNFLEAGGVRVGGVARWDGQEWHAVGAPLGEGCPSIASDGQYVYLSGRVGSAVDGISRSVQNPLRGIVRFDGEDWKLMGAGISPAESEIYDIQPFNDGIFVAARFGTTLAEWRDGK